MNNKNHPLQDGFKNGVVSVMSCSEAVSIKSCLSRDSTRIAKTDVLSKDKKFFGNFQTFCQLILLGNRIVRLIPLIVGYSSYNLFTLDI